MNHYCHPWIYLGHQYTGKEAESIEYAHITANKFRRLGYLVESPIENTHYTHQWILKQRDFITYNSKKKLDLLYPIIDYVEADIQKIKSLRNRDHLFSEIGNQPGYDSGIVLALDPSVFKMPFEIRGVKFTKQHPHEYFEAYNKGKITGEEFASLWSSEGCFLEWDFCYQNNILIIDANRFLEICEVRRSAFKIYSGWMLINVVLEQYPEVQLFR